MGTMLPPVTCANLLKPIEEIVGCGPLLWPDGQFVNGSPDTPVRGVLVTWMAEATALEKAAASGCNVVLCHEAPFFEEKHELPPYRWLNAANDVTELPWHPNRRRRELIQRYKLTLVQCHYGLDRFPIYDAFIQALGLTTAVHEQGWESIYQLPQMLSVAQLARAIKRRLGIQGTVRVVGDLRRRVRKIASLWGGLGLSGNIYWARRAITHGAEAAIAGEMDEAFIKFAAEVGLPVIETSHQLSEEIGLQRYAAVLQGRYPKLKVATFFTGRPYRTI